MRKLAIIAVAAIGLALTGCASTDPEDAYVQAVTARTPEVLDRGTPADLVEMGYNVCESIADGGTAKEFAEWLTTVQISEREASSITELAETHLC